MEWYERINTCGIYKKFYPCTGRHKTTTLGLWNWRMYSQEQGKKKAEKLLRLVTPWGTRRLKASKPIDTVCTHLRYERVAQGITLLLEFLQDHAEKCGDVIVIKTNVGAFATYIAKDCYPKTLQRQSYLDSVKIHRLLRKPDLGAETEAVENRMMHPRQLKAWFVQ